MPRTAADVMRSDVLTIAPETPLRNVHRLFVDEEITGAPVVDETGRVLGVLSATDLVRAVAEDDDEGDATFLRDMVELSGRDWGGLPEEYADRLQRLQACDAMSDEPIAVAPETPIPEVARRMRFHRIHRVLVLEDGRLRGLLTTFDLVGLLEKDG